MSSLITWAPCPGRFSTNFEPQNSTPLKHLAHLQIPLRCISTTQAFHATPSTLLSTPRLKPRIPCITLDKQDPMVGKSHSLRPAATGRRHRACPHLSVAFLSSTVRVAGCILGSKRQLGKPSICRLRPPTSINLNKPYESASKGGAAHPRSSNLLVV